MRWRFSRSQRWPSWSSWWQGRVVDDQEDLATRVAKHELPQELPEGDAVEHRDEAERELGSVERNRAEDVRGLAQPIRIDARLLPDARPRAMQASVLPEAGFVLEHDDASAASGLPADRGQALGEPELLRLLVGTRQPLARPLHRESELMQQPRDVVVVVANAEPPADQIADPRARPDPARIARRLGTLLDQPSELLVLLRGEPRGRARRLAGPQRFGPVGVVPPKPLVYRRRATSNPAAMASTFLPLV
jgi:hypothetical protein